MDKGDPRPLQKLGEKFARQSAADTEEDLAAATAGEGVRVWFDKNTGKAMMSAPGLGTTAVRELIRAGVVKVTERHDDASRDALVGRVM